VQQLDGVRHRPPGRQHRVEHDDRLRAEVVGQRLQVGHRLVAVLVTGHPDEAHPRLRDQGVRLVDHAQTGPEHRDQQRRGGQPDAPGLGERGAHPDLFSGCVPGGLVDQHVGEVAQGGAELGVAGAFVTQCGQPGCGQRMVDDVHVHDRRL